MEIWTNPGMIKVEFQKNELVAVIKNELIQGESRFRWAVDNVRSKFIGTQAKIVIVGIERSETYEK